MIKTTLQYFKIPEHSLLPGPSSYDRPIAHRGHASSGGVGGRQAFNAGVRFVGRTTDFDASALRKTMGEIEQTLERDWTRAGRLKRTLVSPSPQDYYISHTVRPGDFGSTRVRRSKGAVAKDALWSLN